jgi:aldehyde dehydrogenase (NAD+)/aldehyde dehydrogenase
MANVTKPVKDRYDNFIGGKFVAPVKGQYFDNPSPVDGKVLLRLLVLPRKTLILL